PVTANPSAVAPGGRVHISVSGFSPGAAFAVTVTGQPGFPVQTPSGAFAWDVVIPASAKPATVVVQASGGSDVASVSYSIVSVPELLPKLSGVSGDRQTGVPGAWLAAPMVAVLNDDTGVPLPGVAVSASASPGAVATF